MDSHILPPFTRCDHLEPINHYSERQTLDAALEALEVARVQLGVAEISNSEGTVKYTAAGLSVDTFNAEMRAVALTVRTGKRYETRRLGS